VHICCCGEGEGGKETFLRRGGGGSGGGGWHFCGFERLSLFFSFGKLGIELRWMDG
jgi:hypothetical protein